MLIHSSEICGYYSDFRAIRKIINEPDLPGTLLTNGSNKSMKKHGSRGERNAEISQAGRETYVHFHPVSITATLPTTFSLISNAEREIPPRS